MAAAAHKRQRSITKNERVEARLNPAQKRRIEHAASLKGTSISDFIVSSADAAAARTIEQHDVWVLTDRDREVFVKALMHPPSPSPRMKAALKRHRKLVHPW
jgi:uncharacterized protein (DUF1778 family)